MPHKKEAQQPPTFKKAPKPITPWHNAEAPFTVLNLSPREQSMWRTFAQAIHAWRKNNWGETQEREAERLLQEYIKPENLGRAKIVQIVKQEGISPDMLIVLNRIKFPFC